MKVACVLLVYCLSQCTSAIDSCGPHGVNIHTLKGHIQGLCRTVLISENVTLNVKVFLGVPYAEPPTKDLRFKTPMEVKAWKGTHNATDYKSSCLRFKDELFEPMKESRPMGGSDAGHHAHTGHDSPINYEGSEDCLYLNVFVPFNTTDSSSPLAVLIWFPGHDREYDASILAAVGEIIVVTVSFRSGLFGFLSVNKPGFSGNYGLFDQKMAMMWVHDNIGSFGGDAGSVTIAGQGISGSMVGLHLLHDVDQKLFQRAISMSGFILDPYIVRDTGVMEHLVYDHLACKGDSIPNVLRCLQGKTVDELTMHLGHLRQTRPFTVLFGPTVDGEFLKRDPKTLLEEDHFTQVDYLLGGNKDDGSVLFNTLPEEVITNLNQTTFISYIRAISTATFADPVTVSAAILGRYLMYGQLTYGERLLKVGSDYMQGNSLMSAKQIAKFSRVYYFQFNHITESYVNTSQVGYGQIIPFVLGHLFEVQETETNHTIGVNHNMDVNHTVRMNHTMEINQTMEGNHKMHMKPTPMWTDADKTLSISIIRAWAGFVKNGTPQMADGLPWQPFTSSSPKSLVWNTDMVPGEIMEPITVDVVEFWAQTIPILDKPEAVGPTTTVSPGHGDHTTPGHGHGDHTTPGHGHGDHTTSGHDHGSPVIDMDINTAAEAVLALTIVVCFLFVVVVVLLFVNFRYGPKYVKKEKYKQNGHSSSSYSPEDIATKM